MSKLRNRLILPVIAAMFFAAATGASAVELLTNGTFEQDLSIGWLTYTYGSLDTVTRGTGYEADPDYELCVYRDYGSGYCQASQTVDVSTTDLAFSVKARLWAYDNDADTLCWAASAIQIFYLNLSDVVLGETRICYKTAPCPWSSNTTLHIINANDDLWHTYSFNINTELANLPGVTPSAVKKIRVAAYDTTAHSC
jgi:hypothetical protein